MICTVELRKNGQITIPDAVRKTQKLKPGDYLLIDVKVVELHDQ